MIQQDWYELVRSSETRSVKYRLTGGHQSNPDISSELYQENRAILWNLLQMDDSTLDAFLPALKEASSALYQKLTFSRGNILTLKCLCRYHIVI